MRHLVTVTHMSFQCPVVYAALPERMSNQTHRYMFLLALLDQIHPDMYHFYDPEAFVVVECKANVLTVS